MRTQDIKIDNVYRLRRNPDYGYVKALKVLKRGDKENTEKFTIVKVFHSVNKDFVFGFVRYFRPCDIVRDH